MFERKGLEKVLAFVRPGDTVVVWKLDRLGRSLKDLIETLNILKERNVEFISLTEKIDTTTPGGKLIFYLMGALAEFERDLIRERTNAGLAAARARGRVGGRPRRLLTNGKVVLARRLLKTRIIPFKIFAQRCCDLLLSAPSQLLRSPFSALHSTITGEITGDCTLRLDDRRIELDWKKRTSASADVLVRLLRREGIADARLTSQYS